MVAQTHFTQHRTEYIILDEVFLPDNSKRGSDYVAETFRIDRSKGSLRLNVPTAASEPRELLNATYESSQRKTTRGSF